jgi:chromosomal replication initiator protein
MAAPADAALGRTLAAALPSFVAGPENGVPAAVLRELMASLDGGDNSRGAVFASWPPVIALFGPSGVGKTHLLCGLVNCWLAARGADAAEYITAGDFRRQLDGAIDTGGVDALRRRLRTRQLLAFDELDRLPNDAYLTEELRNTLDECEAAGGLVVLAANRLPASLGNLSTDVRSRLSAGLMLPLAAPGAAAREALARQAAAALGRSITDDAARRLAAGVDGTAAQLFGAMFELAAAEPDLILIDAAAVQRLLVRRDARRTTLREIIAVVARYYNLPQKLLKSGSRKHAAVVARATIVYLARELAGASYEQIGRSLGGRDHSTIMHNYRTIDRERRRDWQTQETLDDLRRVLSCS